MNRAIFCGALVLALLPGSGWAIPVEPDVGKQASDVFGELLGELTGLFVVATVMESALSLLFQWRLYREFFNGHAVKTVVIVAIGYFVVVHFDYDIFDRIVRIARGASTVSESAGDAKISRFLSACVLAGGSAAVNQLFKALGLRSPVDPEQEKPKPPSDRAWVSVKVNRKMAVGDIQIHIEKVGIPNAGNGAPLSRGIAGIVGVRKNILKRLKEVFFADLDRLPPYGGIAVEAGPVYRIWVEGTLDDGSGIPPRSVTNELYRGAFFGRSIINFVADL
ncbi:hypothetical protein [Dokdonella ginsengisoli]|uniref:Uncharacterized protein n=1 Tax=Dokdonella ginsengisoli TaxID=363846 RepID=A0ABV9QY84_9GAMM